MAALWRVLDIYKREAITPQNLASLAFAGNPDTLRGQAPDKTQITEQGGKLKVEKRKPREKSGLFVCLFGK